MLTFNSIYKYLKKKPFVAIFFAYILGFIIYSIPLSFFFKNLPINDLRLLNYLSASLWYILILSIIYSLYNLFNKKLFPIIKKGKSRLLSLFLIPIVIIFLCFLFSLIIYFIINYTSNANGILYFVKSIPNIIMDIPFKIINSFLRYINHFLLLISSIILLHRLEKGIKTSSLTLMGIVFFVSVLTFSQGVYTSIPRVIGGGKPTQVKIIFKNGNIPEVIKNKIIQGDIDKEYLVEEDASFYYVAFTKEIAISNKSSSNYRRILESTKTIIPKENIIAIYIDE